MIVQTKVPAGYTIRYESTPRKRIYEIGGVEVPSVTTVLGVLDKPALPWWGMKVGVEGVLKLFAKAGRMDGDTQAVLRRAEIEDTLTWGPLEDVIALLTEHKLTVNHNLRKAGDRGTGVHDATEELFAGGWPNTDKFPPEDLGYVSAACDFWISAFHGDVPKRARSEVMVGSKEHGYAGRFDLEALAEGAELVTDAERGTTAVFDGLGLWDYKTSKGVYLSHFIQLEAYELARVECGYEPTDFRAVVHLMPDGRYEVVKSYARPETFLSILATYNAVKADEAAKPKRPRATPRKEAA